MFTSAGKSDAPDLSTQFESMLDQVWRSEADWRLWDRLDAAGAIEEALRRKKDDDKDGEKAA